MPEFERQDLTGARFSDVLLREAVFRRVDLSGAVIRSSRLEGLRLRGVDLIDVEIDGDLRNVVVNGVDIAPLVEAELDRRDPLRVAMRPTDADGHREAWALLEGLWDETVARASALPPEALHERVGGEWSFIQTVRHLGFATAAWIERLVLGVASPWHPLDLPWDDAPGWEGIPWDRQARPPLDEVLEVRRRRQALVRQVMADLTDEGLAETVGCTEPGWPQIEAIPVADCLRVVLNEEYLHRRFAERDLVSLTATAG